VTADLAAGNATLDAGKGKGKGKDAKGKGKENNGLAKLLQESEAALQAGGQQKQGGLLESLGLGNLLGGANAEAGKAKNNAGEVGAGAAPAEAGKTKHAAGDVLGAGAAAPADAGKAMPPAAAAHDAAALGMARNKKRTATSFRA
jgi:hypothetical protein